MSEHIRQPSEVEEIPLASDAFWCRVLILADRDETVRGTTAYKKLYQRVEDMQIDPQQWSDLVDQVNSEVVSEQLVS